MQTTLHRKIQRAWTLSDMKAHIWKKQDLYPIANVSPKQQ